MVKLTRSGSYVLIETKRINKILILDNKDNFAWINTEKFGEILVTTHNPHFADYILATGKYREYEVMDEPGLTNAVHLELFVGNGMWQGYLLSAGLPTEKKKRARIIPTNEKITVSSY